MSRIYPRFNAPWILASVFTVLFTALAASASEPFRIDVVDEENGWPVALVELRTVHNARFVSYNNYSFYNPILHPELTTPDSPVLLFEGTFITFFTDHAVPTARHDYNQVMYRLDLDGEWMKGE